VVTIAPEVAGAMTLIDYMVKHGVRVSIGHTAAPPAVIREAIARGATLSTHLGNGCAQMLPRHPTSSGAAGRRRAHRPVSSSMAITCRRRL
jgi:N-acetylglucosamine-6-phosphate deacetylase